MIFVLWRLLIDCELRLVTLHRILYYYNYGLLPLFPPTLPPPVSDDDYHHHHRSWCPATKFGDHETDDDDVRAGSERARYKAAQMKHKPLLY